MTSSRPADDGITGREPHVSMNSAPRPRYLVGPDKKALLDRLLEEEGLAVPQPTRIPRRASRSSAPLSYAQQRLWFLDRLVPGNPFYNVDAVVPIRAVVDPRLLASTLDRIVARHEVLRTVIVERQGSPVQVAAPELQLPLALLDLRSIEPARRDAETRRAAHEEARRPFDLSVGPLVRACLVTRSDDDHVLLLTMHHIISDGWSLGVFSREMTEIYTALASGREPRLLDLPIQYGDFAEWQRAWLSGPRLEEQLGYWRQQLASLTPLRLPLDKRRPAVPTFQGGFQPVSVPFKLTNRLKEISQAEGATLFMTTLAAFKVLVCRYARQEDIAIGSPIANRNHPEIEPLIGFFVNTLVLRTDLSGNPTFRELLRRVRQTAIGAYAHQDLPFERLVEELHPDRDLSRNPLFQVIFQLFSAGHVAPAPTDDRLMVESQRGTAKFDLRFDLWETSDGLRGQLEYSSDLFEPESIARMVTHYLVLLQGIGEHPDTPIHELPLLTRAEERQLAAWNATAEPFPLMPIHAQIEAQVRRGPHRPAVEFGAVHWTYQQLDERANAIAWALCRQGVVRDTPVAVLLERSAGMIAAFVGILKAGGAYVPLDPSHPADRLAFMLEDSAAAVVIASRDTHHLLTSTAAAVLDVEALISTPAADAPPVRVEPNDLAYIIYTSGSTGQPKGVCVEHRSISALVHTHNYADLSSADAVLQGSNASFDAATFEIWATLVHGARLVGVSKEVVLSPPDLVRTLREKQLSIVFLTTVLFNKVVAEIPDAFRSIRHVLFGGEACDPRWVRAALADGPQALTHAYGPTETTTFATYYHVRSVPDSTPQIPIGRPITNTTVYILDPYFRPVPPGAIGEVVIGGEGVARGYWQRPELTADRFVPDSFGAAGQRLYRTGDLGRFLPTGDVEFYGRTDHQVKVRGFRVELGEIETALGGHPAVHECAVMAAKGSLGNLRLIAYVAAHRAYFEAQTSTEDQVQRGALVDQWRHSFDSVVYDGIDTGDVPVADPTFNIVGWNSSYTGLPIPPEEMREQVDRTVERILALEPRRILEIGCGTGLLLFRLAPHVETYVGTDFSGVALRFARTELDRDPERYRHVQLLERTADDFSGLDRDRFDTVVLNSIVQYLPSIGDLRQIIESAVDLVADAGVIFLGDLRAYPLLDCLHSSIELSRAPATLTMADLRERIDRQVRQDHELTVDPAFFSRMREICPRITAVQVQQKRGRGDNELTRFRYDVVLQVSGPGEAQAITRWHDWDDDPWPPARIAEELEAGRPEQFAVRGIPNARLAADGAALDSERDPSLETVGELRTRLEEASGDVLHPEDYWALAERLPYDVLVRWSPGAPHRLFDVLLTSRAGRARRAVQHFSAGSPTHADLSRHANNPLQARFMRSLVPELQRHLQHRLPDYMCPSTYVLLPALPVSPNGKVDRSALASAERARPQIERPYVAPAHAMEERLASIWATVLGLELVGVHDDFFTELGGHSLLAAQVVSRIRDELRLEMPLRWMFEAPTIAAITGRLTELRRSSSLPQADPAIERGGQDRLPDVAALTDDEVDRLLDEMEPAPESES